MFSLFKIYFDNNYIGFEHVSNIFRIPAYGSNNNTPYGMWVQLSVRYIFAWYQNYDTLALMYIGWYPLILNIHFSIRKHKSIEK